MTRRRALAALLVSAVVERPYDGISKTSALVALAVLAPALEKAAAVRGLRALLPLAAGARPPQAPPYLRSHANLKRARSVLRRDVTDVRLQSAALQACGLLAARGAPRSLRLARVIDGALELPMPEELVVMALSALVALPELPVRSDPLALLEDERKKVQRAAETVLAARGSKY